MSRPASTRPPIMSTPMAPHPGRLAPMPANHIPQATRGR